MNKILIIGAGASGLMAAITAARAGAQVTILEQNDKPGKKILATGNGRCNLTNIHQEPSHYRCSQPDFPWKIVEQFSYMETLQFFSKIGIFTKNRQGWMYPFSDQASSVAEVLEMEARNLKVKIKTKEEVTKICPLRPGFQVLTKTWHYECDKLILACGSHASSVEGSSDAGYRFARELGHHVVPPLPALAALKGKGSYFGKWAGTRMDGVVSLEIQGEIFKKERGEILFTDYGISGIPVFQISRYAIRAIHEGCTVVCHLDLMPEFSPSDLLSLLETRRASTPYKTMTQSLIGLLPKKLIQVMATDASSEIQVTQNLKDWQIPIKDAYSLKQAQVCSGGVDTRELTCSLESTLLPGLYFTGEVVDVDGPCGGYNLQWAWSSGAVAGKAAAAR